VTEGGRWAFRVVGCAVLLPVVFIPSCLATVGVFDYLEEDMGDPAALVGIGAGAILFALASTVAVAVLWALEKAMPAPPPKDPPPKNDWKAIAPSDGTPAATTLEATTGPPGPG